MDIYELFEAQRQLTYKYIDGMTEVLPQDLGLDKRCAYRLFVNKEAIAVPLKDDRSLQYYAGFEYIDKAFRSELGDWVIYTIDDQIAYGEDEDAVCRIAECIKNYYEPEQLCPVED